MGNPLTAVVVTYNEAHYLTKCLESISFCDDILVVDLGSHDESVEIAQQNGARVINHKWVAFAEKVRPFALEHVANEWILFVDPDIFIPEGVGRTTITLIEKYTEQGLGMIYLPFHTYFGRHPLRYGQKGGRRGYRAVLHRERVEITTLLHFQGLRLLDDYFALGVTTFNGEVLHHYWIDSIRDFLTKAHRYLPYEPERRQAANQEFSWKGMLLELGDSLKLDIKKRAFLEWRAIQVMFLQLWYIYRANMALRMNMQ